MNALLRINLKNIAVVADDIAFVLQPGSLYAPGLTST